jgi:hypothetical protein
MYDTCWGLFVPLSTGVPVSERCVNVGAMTRVSLALLVVLAGCSSSSDPKPAAPEPAGTPTPVVKSDSADTGGLGAPKIPWKDKNREQRMEYMGLFVLDKMNALFAEWRPDEYGAKDGFRCQTCHGDGFDKPPVDFHMPRVAFPLDPKDPIGVAMKYDAVATKFMIEKVVPTMAGLLNEEPYDQATGKGTFGCFRCHPKKGEKVP